jgi:hypothetical protein
MCMHRYLGVLALVVTVAPVSTSAMTAGPAIVTYQLTGSAFVDCVDGDRNPCGTNPPPVSDNDGTIGIDERLLSSRSLVSQHLEFFPTWPDWQALAMDLPFSRIAGRALHFEIWTDDARQPVSWRISDGGITGQADDLLQTPDGLWWKPVAWFQREPTYVGPGGRLTLANVTPSPVPLPAAGLLLSVGLACIAGLRRRDGERRAPIRRT